MLCPNKFTAPLFAALSLTTLLTLEGCSTMDNLHRGDVAGNPSYLKARSLMEKGQYKQAVPLLKGLVDAYPDAADAGVNLAIAYRENGQIDEALNVLDSVVTKHPDHAAAQNQLGIVERQLGHFDKALAAYQQAIAMDGNYALAYRNLGILYDIYLQKPNSALSHYEKYLALMGDGDDEVNNWIIELKRRLKAEHARNN